MACSEEGSSYRPMCGEIPGSRWSPEKRRPLPGRCAGCSSSRCRQTWPGVWPGVQIARSLLSGEGKQFAGEDLPVGDGGPQPGQGAQPAVRPGGAQGCEVGLGGSGGGQLPGHVVEPDAGLGGAGPYDDLGVGGVHGDPGAGGRADLAGEAVVVGVVVGDDDAVDVGDREAEGAEAA